MRCKVERQSARSAEGTRAIRQGRQGGIHCLILVVCVIGAMQPGCQFPTAAENTVLAGTWTASIKGQLDFNNMLLDFDSQGTLIRISYESGNEIVSVPTPLAVTNVHGRMVTVSISLMGNSMVYSGTLDANYNEITGVVSGTVMSDGISVDLEEIVMNLTRL